MVYAVFELIRLRAGKVWQSTSLLLALVLLTPQTATGDQLLAEETLENLKRSLADYALESGVHVAASAWLDQGGAFAEDVFLVSNLKIEGLQINQIENRFGYPEDTILRRDEKSVPPNQSCLPSRSIRRRMLVHLPQLDAASNRTRIVAREIAEIVKRSSISFSGLNSHALVSLERPDSYSLYDSALADSPQEEANIDIRIDIKVEERRRLSLGFVSQGLSRHWAFPVAITLEAIEHGETIFLGGGEIQISQKHADYLMPVLSRDDRAFTEIESLIENILLELSQTISCLPVANLILVDKFGERRINGGADLGVAKGQKFFLLPDSGNFAHMGVAKSIAATSLVVVSDVFDVYSIIEPLSGELPQYGSEGFLLIPIDSLDFLSVDL